jgi:hypothetical protein
MVTDTSDTGTATVFISHATDDNHLAKQVKNEFVGQGLLCWEIDEEIDPGTHNWRDEVEKAIDRVTCVVVLWTSESTKRNWVKAEAEKALNQSKLQQLYIDDAKPPMPFGEIQGIHCNTDKGQLDTVSLRQLVSYIKGLADLKGPNERILQPRKFGEQWDCDDLILRGPVPGTDLFVSFHPCNSSGIFSRVRASTTEGWVDERIQGAIELHAPYKGDPSAEIIEGTSKKTRYLRTKNEIFFINDPVRPYSMQIGRLRSLRSPRLPKYINCKISNADLDHIGLGDPDMCELLASVLEDREALEHLWEEVSARKRKFGDEAVDRILMLIARNPHSPEEIQNSNCLFCKDTFKQQLSVENDTDLGAYITENSFPFGPYFHYIVITLDAIHSWESLEIRHVYAMNILAHRYIKKQLSDSKSKASQAAGIEYGFNSTVKHLVLGRRTHTSAGASIPHVHKQIWGMAPRTSNLAEQLILVSEAYWRQGIDYQACYHAALSTLNSVDDYSYIVWEDTQVALYVPYGQCSKHEMQIMTLQPRGNITDLEEEEMASLSKAEYIAIRIYKELNVTSFNQIVLSKLFKDHRAPRFRLVVSFVTREVDLAMSELSMLYVVDQHPWDSRKEIQTAWKRIEQDVIADIETFFQD